MNKGGPLARLRALTSGAGFKLFGLGAGLLIGLGIVALGTSMEVSSQPAFCGSCHIMKPYYESWQESSHGNIACVDCHIPPGVTAELRKKYEALSMVARYFTGTYGTNPWTEIDDAACLRCHERRLLSGKELFGDVLFDHAAHLAGMRRGKRLRCTSCHSQLVQGSHIAVTVSTCILCHFKDQPSGTGTARCTICHQIPDRVIRKETLTFNHADVARFGMDCASCHARPEGSDGAVPRERCVTCHNQPSRLAEYEATDLLHQKHVTEHKVDCIDCHLEIEHVSPPELVRAASTCDACHQGGHSPQQTLYTGRGGRGVEPMPDPMFLAGVRCEGCHIAIPGEESAIHRASEISCMSCHGPSYRTIFLSWKRGLDTRTTALERQMKRTASALRGEAAALADARFNLDLVKRGGGVHNVRYAYALLQRSHEDMNIARRNGNLAPLEVPWTEIPFESPCLSCHQGIEEQKGMFSGRSYRHAPHVLRAGIECVTCHLPHEERTDGKAVRFDRSGCDSCHHREADQDCLTCHAGVRERTVSSSLGDFDHAFHLDDVGVSCPDCHTLSPGGSVSLETETCSNCHG